MMWLPKGTTTVTESDYGIACMKIYYPFLPQQLLSSLHNNQIIIFFVFWKETLK